MADKIVSQAEWFARRMVRSGETRERVGLIDKEVLDHSRAVSPESGRLLRTGKLAD